MSACNPSVMLALPDVAGALAWLRQQGARHLQCDSRKVKAGDAFVAWPGFATDGRRYVPGALRSGAVACLVEADGLPEALAAGLWADDAQPVPSERQINEPPVASLAQLKSVTGPLAAAFYGHPSRQLRVVAVTGTNGKTSTTWWLSQALAALNKPCGLMGTLGVGVPGAAAQALSSLETTGLTTPDPILCQATLRRWAKQGVWACAVEASSIGIAEHRLAGTELAVAVFTNFTQDHLDYHGTMDAYWQAKRALFAMPGLHVAVINADDPRGSELATELTSSGLEMDVWTTSLDAHNGARLTATGLQPTPAGMRFTVREKQGANGASADLAVPFVGDYNAANLLGVLATLRALGVPLADAVHACTALTAVPGRMAPVNGDVALAGVSGAADLPLVLVDYAHTPDALDKALAALRPVVLLRGGALHCVVGCGGDRDATKRPLMAASAEAGAVHVCLTSDNPRSEDPHAILAQMVAGLRQPAHARVEPERASAIAKTIAAAEKGDVVLIAGKGHETTQDVRGVKHPFSDHAHALAALRNRLMETQT